MGLLKRSDVSNARDSAVLDADSFDPRTSSTEELLDLLELGSLAERRQAARGLTGRVEASAAMIGHLMRETSLSVRGSIFAALIQTPGPETVRSLVRLLQSEDANLRNESIDVLSTMPELVAPLMDSMLKNSDSDVRIFAVNIMASIQHRQVVDWLVDILMHDQEVNVCATALDLVAEVGDERCLPALDAAQARFADEPYLEFVIDLARSRIENLNASNSVDH